MSGRRVPYADQFAWLRASGAVRLPAVVAPAGLTRSGPPVGVQIVGPAFEDRTPIEFAHTMAGSIGGFTPPPRARTAALT